MAKLNNTRSTRKIGNAKLVQLDINAPKESGYSDGEIEDQLLDLFTSKNPIEKKRSILESNPNWPLYYHLTPRRGNLVNWYSFDTSSSILEVGAGCGAITEALLEQNDSSTKINALELSLRRALVNVNRNKSYKNLTVTVGNLEDLSDQEKYDYVVCVGVLEYAGKFISSNEPFQAFADSLFNLLNPGGKLLLAIENKMGLKYFNGSREDHVGVFFESVMSYPHYEGIKTFSKKELSQLMTSTGFETVEFNYPIPDYKIPKIVVSDETLNSDINLNSIMTKYFPSPAPDQDRVELGSEQLMARSVIDAGLFGEMANSFLIEATKAK